MIVAATITFCSVALGSGVYAGIQWEDQRQEDRIEAQVWRESDRFWALSDAYEVAYDDELRERGFSEEEIRRGHAAAFKEFVSGEEKGPDLPAPTQSATLEIRDQLHAAEARRDALLDARTDD